MANRFFDDPKGFNAEHQQLANAALEDLKKDGYEVHKTWIDGDGWDGIYKCVWAIIEKKHELYKIHWCDSNKEFFVDLKSGASCPLRLHLLPRVAA